MLSLHSVIAYETLLYITLNVVIGDLDKDQSRETTCYFYFKNYLCTKTTKC